jgi:RNA polymerase sigma factor (sigma-70 family)
VHSVPVAEEWDAEHAVIAIYSTHYRSLVRLAALLVGDVGIAEDIVRQSFIAMHADWRRLRDSNKAIPYLRRCVVDRSRSVLSRQLAERTAHQGPAVGEGECGARPGRSEAGPEVARAEPDAPPQSEQSALMSALRTLPCSQREALVLRFYLDLTEGQIAAVMGVSRGAVRAHLSKATVALRAVLPPGG